MIRLTSGVLYTVTTTGDIPPHPASTGPVTVVNDILPVNQAVKCTVPFPVERKFLLKTDNTVTFRYSGTIYQAKGDARTVTFMIQTTVPGDLTDNRPETLPALIAYPAVFPETDAHYTYGAFWVVTVNRVNAANNVSVNVKAGLDITTVTPDGVVQLTGTGSYEQPWTLAPMPSGELPVTALPDKALVMGAVMVSDNGPIVTCGHAEAEYAP